MLIFKEKMRYILALVFLSCCSALPGQNMDLTHATQNFGGITRLDSTTKKIYLSFTGGDYNDGKDWIIKVLRRKKIKANFFFTGDFYRLLANRKVIKKLRRSGHYLGPHSDKHLLYASWENRDALLVSKAEFNKDLLDNYEAMLAFGIKKEAATFFMPPYEWYNDSISIWAKELEVQVVNFSPGTYSNADYTTPDMGKRYRSSAELYKRILDYESTAKNGLNGFILLLHIGTHPDRTDKFYYRLADLVEELKRRGYQFGSLIAFQK